MPAALIACALLVADALPSVAVMPLSNRNGVSADAASLVTENLVDELRRSSVFHRVTSWPELQALLSLDQTRQLANCDETSCVTEIMGSLNVDYAVLGTLGKLGRHWLVNVQLLHVRTSTAASSLSLRVCAVDEGGLLAGILPVLTHLLYEAKLSKRRPVPLASEYRECTDQQTGERLNAPAAPPPPKAESGPRRSTLVRLGVVGGGAVALALGFASVVASVAGAVASGAWVYRLLTPSLLAETRTGPLVNEGRLGLLWGTALALGVPAAVAGVAALVLLGVGFTAVVVGVLTGVL